ncbi:DUF6516 family protein [Halalkalicoccus sp. NIPERK01]|nr:DUF6516 family protein [Halalkalicoccus sp. NIPERK01]
MINQLLRELLVFVNKLYYGIADGNSLLRYDNSPYHLDVGRHHRHTPEGAITKLEFTGLSDLIDDFQTEVNEIYERQTD